MYHFVIVNTCLSRIYNLHLHKYIYCHIAIVFKKMAPPGNIFQKDSSTWQYFLKRWHHLALFFKKMAPPGTIFQKDGATMQYFSKRWRHLALFFKKMAPPGTIFQKDSTTV